MSNKIKCTKVNQEFSFHVWKEGQDLRYDIRQKDGSIPSKHYGDCPGVEVEENIPEAGMISRWGKHNFSCIVRAMVTYNKDFVCYILEDTRLGLWVFPQRLDLI